MIWDERLTMLEAPMREILAAGIREQDATGLLDLLNDMTYRNEEG